jgi:tripartite-type tricarboxylate transporter receptor subunit TctC
MKMKPFIDWVAQALVAVIACLGVVGAAQADSYPDRPIQLIVPFPAGSGTDIMGRIVAEGMAKRLGGSVVVMNRPGASTIIGAQFVANSPADGYTLLLASYNHAINPSIFKTVPFDPVRDFSAVGGIGDLPFALVVNPSLPVHNVGELVAFLKRNPGKYAYASTGNGTPPHVAGELFKKEAGIKMMHVPYKGSAAALAAVMGGEVPVMFVNIASAQAQITGHKLRVLAVTTPERLAQLPGTPTMVEQGYPDFNITIWGGMLAPAQTPTAVIEKLTGALRATLASADTRKKLNDQGMRVHYTPPAQFSAFVRSEITRLGKIATAIHLEAN